MYLYSWKMKVGQAGCRIMAISVSTFIEIAVFSVFFTWLTYLVGRVQ